MNPEAPARVPRHPVKDFNGTDLGIFNTIIKRRKPDQNSLPSKLKLHPIKAPHGKTVDQQQKGDNVLFPAFKAKTVKLENRKKVNTQNKQKPPNCQDFYWSAKRSFLLVCDIDALSS